MKEILFFCFRNDDITKLLCWFGSWNFCYVLCRGGFRVQKKMVTNFCEIDTIYIKVIAFIFVAIIVVIIIIVNVAIFVLFWNFSGYSMIYTNVGSIRDPLEQDLALEFCRKQNKYISILTQNLISNMIKYSI